ncbi:universal stress protein [Haloarculaceae archaeon H-GB2-1]|nr:universal stress protein [Haloarculaceae archaeon H-GB2-1]
MLTLRPGRIADSSYPYRSVLLPTDGSESATAALDQAVGLSRTHDAALHLLSVIDVGSLGTDVRALAQTEAIEANANEALDDAERYAKAESVDAVSTAVVEGTSVPGSIRSYVEENDVDLLVLGTHGRTGLDRFLLGSVTEKLVRKSPVPVLTVHSPEEG